jgi:WD40 repeat protein
MMNVSCCYRWQGFWLFMGMALMLSLAGCGGPTTGTSDIPSSSGALSTSPAVSELPTIAPTRTPENIHPTNTPTELPASTATLTPVPLIPFTAQNLAEITEIETHAMNLDEAILAAGWSRDYSRLAVVRGDQVQVLDGQSLQAENLLPVGVYSQAVLFDPLNSERLITGSNDGQIRFWNLASNTVDLSLPAQPKGVNRLVVGSSGELLASAGNDALIYLWRLPDGEETGRLIGSAFVVPDLAISPKGDTLISVDGGVIRVREIATGRLVISIYTDGSIPEIAVSPDGLTIAAAHSGGLIQLYDIQSGELVWESEPQPGSEPWTVDFHPNGSLLASGWRNGAVCWQDVQVPENVICKQAHTHPVGVVRFRPDGLLMLSGGYDGWLRFWQAGP